MGINITTLLDLAKKLFGLLPNIITINSNNTNINIIKIDSQIEIKKVWEDISKDISINVGNKTDSMWMHTHNESKKSLINIGKYFSCVVHRKEIKFWIGAEATEDGTSGVYIWFSEKEFALVLAPNSIRLSICGEFPQNSPCGAYIIPIKEFSDCEKSDEKLEYVLIEKLKQFLEEIFNHGAA